MGRIHAVRRLLGGMDKSNRHTPKSAGPYPARLRMTQAKHDRRIESQGGPDYYLQIKSHDNFCPRQTLLSDGPSNEIGLTHSTPNALRRQPWPWAPFWPPDNIVPPWVSFDPLQG